MPPDNQIKNYAKKLIENRPGSVYAAEESLPVPPSAKNVIRLMDVLKRKLGGRAASGTHIALKGRPRNVAASLEVQTIRRARSKNGLTSGRLLNL